MPLRLLLCLAMFWLAGCASIADDPVHSARVTLSETHSTPLSRTATLHYDSVVDSRCPRGVLCIWAGNVVYHFTLASNRGKEAFTLDHEGQRTTSVKLPGLAIVLASAPVPAVGAKDHPVTLDIVASPP